MDGDELCINRRDSVVDSITDVAVIGALMSRAAGRSAGAPDTAKEARSEMS